jgi:hypothetical protein
MNDEGIHSDPHAAAAHQPELVRRHDVVRAMHGDSRAAEFNRRLALFITKNVGTMWCAYLFTLIAMTGAVAILTGNMLLTLIVNLISQTFIQLVLLPIIIVGQNVQAEATDRRAEADHKTLVALHTMNKTQLQILEALQRLSNSQEELLNRLAAKS